MTRKIDPCYGGIRKQLSVILFGIYFKIERSAPTINYLRNNIDSDYWVWVWIHSYTYSYKWLRCEKNHGWRWQYSLGGVTIVK